VSLINDPEIKLLYVRLVRQLRRAYETMGLTWDRDDLFIFPRKEINDGNREPVKTLAEVHQEAVDYFSSPLV